jgi:hypothetical protein
VDGAGAGAVIGLGRSALSFACLLISFRASAADVCPTGNDPAAGPLPGGIGPADFGAVPEACAATDAMLRLRAALTAASSMPDYYGSLMGVATLRGRYQLGEQSAVSFAADVINYRYINNANLASEGPSVGPATVAFLQTVGLGAGAATTVYARALLPVDSARQNGIETGLEIGAGLRARAGARWIIAGGLALAAPADIVGGQIHARLGSSLLAEAWLRLRPWVAFGAGIDTRVGASPTFELVSTVPRAAVRFRLPRRLWMAALVELPVAGRDRTDLIGGLFLGFSAN